MSASVAVLGLRPQAVITSLLYRKNSFTRTDFARADNKWLLGSFQEKERR